MEPLVLLSEVANVTDAGTTKKRSKNAEQDIKRIIVSADVKSDAFRPTSEAQYL